MKIPPSMEQFDALDKMQQAVASVFCDLVRDTLTSHETFRVSLSGGSTPKRIYELVAQCDLPWDRIHWFWGDERNVPHDHDDSNARMVREALLNRIDAPKQNIHPVPVNVSDPASAAAEYEQILREQFGSEEFPRWDLNLLGMGDDAHTASLFPGTKALDIEDRWFVQNWVEKFDGYRYTLTAPAINSSRNAWFLVAGAAKKDALAQVLSEKRDTDRLPSQLIHPTRWFVTSNTLGS